MSKLITKISINRTNDNQLSCILDIKTVGQYITKWNKQYWKLELEIFESALLDNNFKEEEWEKYNKIAKGKNFLYTVVSFALGVAVYCFATM